MSLSEEKSIEVNYRRDSFSDRVWDDLCKEILQFLSPEDCIRLECVSKQFQRTAFLSQRSQYFKIPQKGLENEKMEQFFKKYPKLNKIILGYCPDYDSYHKQGDPTPFQEFVKYCNNLTHIEFGNYLMNKEIIKKLFDKFGNKLISIRNWSLNRSPDLLYGIASTNAINIEELTIDSFDSDLTQIKFNRLKSFEVSNLREEDLDGFEVFIENNLKTLKHLDVLYNGIDDKDYIKNEENVRRFFKIILKAVNLIHLAIDRIIKITDELYAYYLNKIAINCKQIKSLNLRLINYESLRLNDGILKHFKQLKRLKIRFWEISVDPLNEFRPPQDLKGLEGLTHLNISVIDWPQNFNESILLDIDINLPKLQSFRINTKFTASEWTAQVLMRLTNLETIGLRITNQEIIPEIERQLIKNCKHFKNLEIISLDWD